MRTTSVLSALLLVSALSVGVVRAERPTQKRENADYVVTGTVTAVYSQETDGYRNYVIDIRVDKVEKGAGIKKGELFRAFCYQRKPGKGGLKYDSRGHTQVPKEGQKVKAFVNRARGLYEGVYPNWFDVLQEEKKGEAKSVRSEQTASADQGEIRLFQPERLTNGFGR
jgi:hypothetical protein